METLTEARRRIEEERHVKAEERIRVKHEAMLKAEVALRERERKQLREGTQDTDFLQNFRDARRRTGH